MTTRFGFPLFGFPEIEEVTKKAIWRRKLVNVLDAVWSTEAEFLRAGPYTTCLLHYANGGEPVRAVGHSKRRPTDQENVLTGDTIALTRALVDLDEQLKGA